VLTKKACTTKELTVAHYEWIFLNQKNLTSLEAGYGAQRHSLDNEVDRLFSFSSPL
jgi:hypothetical protein